MILALGNLLDDGAEEFYIAGSRSVMNVTDRSDLNGVGTAVDY